MVFPPLMDVEGVGAVGSASVGAASIVAAGQHQPSQQHGKKPPRCKRKRRASGEGKRGGGGGRQYGYRPPHKKAKPSVSSTRAANNIMKFRLGGSVSDPLNLEGEVSDECSTCAPSPAPMTGEDVIAPPIMTPHLNKDPLNLEGKVKNFPLIGIKLVTSCANC